MLKATFLGAVITAATFFLSDLGFSHKDQLARGMNASPQSSYWSCPPYCRLNQAQIQIIFKEKLPDGYQDQAPILAKNLLRLARKFKFDPAFLLSVIQAESGFRPRAFSPVGARGLMQLMPDTAAFIARIRGISYAGRHELMDPVKNIHLGIVYLDHLRTYYRGDFSKMMVSYNMGPARLDQYIRKHGFRIHSTKPYIDAIRLGVVSFRKYSAHKYISQKTVSKKATSRRVI